MSPRVDVCGQRFGRLIVVERVNKIGRGVWKCKCDCGKEATVTQSNLKVGRTRSCGCLKIDETRKLLTTHGCTDTVLHNLWMGMLSRCSNKNEKSYPRYGGRGISVCDRWKESFVNFKNDVGERPDGCSLDRINNDGNYEPGNVRWATRAVQARNTRRTIMITAFGETLCIQDQANKFAIGASIVRSRINLGWSIEDALTTPPRRSGYKLHAPRKSRVLQKKTISVESLS